jgi:hypothetical protein
VVNTVTNENKDQEQEQAKGDEQKEEPKLVPEADLNNLRSTYDRQLSDARSEISNLSNKIKEIETKDASAQIVKDVEARLSQIDFTADDALEKVTDLTRVLARNLSRLDEQAASDASFAQTTYADNLALQLVLEHGGDFEVYRRQLHQEPNAERMKLAADKLALQLDREGKAKENVSNGNTQRMDEGRGGAAQGSTLLKEMQDIDVSTPEGMAAWDKKEAEFERRLRQTAKAR